MAEDWVQLVIGLWILLSPWFLGFSQIGMAKWSNVLLGLALVILNAWKLSLGKSKGHQ